MWPFAGFWRNHLEMLPDYQVVGEAPTGPWRCGNASPNAGRARLRTLRTMAGS